MFQGDGRLSHGVCMTWFASLATKRDPIVIGYVVFCCQNPFAVETHFETIE